LPGREDWGRIGYGTGSRPVFIPLRPPPGTALPASSASWAD